MGRVTEGAQAAARLLSKVGQERDCSCTAPDTLDLCYAEIGADAEATCWVLQRAP